MRKNLRFIPIYQNQPKVKLSLKTMMEVDLLKRRIPSRIFGTSRDLNLKIKK